MEYLTKGFYQAKCAIFGVILTEWFSFSTIDPWWSFDYFLLTWKVGDQFREVIQVKKLLKRTFFKKYVLRTFLLSQFLDGIHQIFSTQGVLRNLKNGIREFCPPNFFIFTFIHQNESFDNLQTRKFEVNKILGKRMAEEIDRKSGYCMLVINYQ